MRLRVTIVSHRGVHPWHSPRLRHQSLSCRSVSMANLQSPSLYLVIPCTVRSEPYNLREQSSQYCLRHRSLSCRTVSMANLQSPSLYLVIPCTVFFRSEPCNLRKHSSQYCLRRHWAFYHTVSLVNPLWHHRISLPYSLRCEPYGLGIVFVVNPILW